jgi:signal transduction histidine kinase
VHCLGLPGRSGIVGRTLGLVAKGAPLPEVLKEVTRDVTATWPGTSCVIELWSAEGPMLLAAVPGPAPRGSALLEAAPTSGLHELGPDSALVKALGAPQWTSRVSDIFGHEVSDDLSHAEWWAQHLHPDDVARVTQSLDRAIERAERFWTCEYRFRRADQRYAWVFDRGALVYDASRRAIRMVGVMEDISRDRELQSQLNLASRLAAVGSFASGVAHELNNPLTWVTSNLGFAIEELQKLHHENEEARERIEEALDALDDAKAGAARIAQIVSDLRTFARSDAEGLHPVAVNHSVESALTMAHNELRHRGRLVRDLQPVPTVLGNEARLVQAVLNLLLNAAWSLAASPGGANEVRVATRTDAEGRAVI